jgi:hypothetical protein
MSFATMLLFYVSPVHSYRCELVSDFFRSTSYYSTPGALSL